MIFFKYIFHGTTKEKHQMYDQINKIHPTLKFTMVHTTPEDKCNCAPRSSIPFLAQNYPENLVNRGTKKARKVIRKVALLRIIFFYINKTSICTDI